MDRITVPMSPTIQVTINPEGTCKEVNPLGEKPKTPESFYLGQRLMRPSANYLKEKLVKWRAAEATLRTFEIDSIVLNHVGKKVALFIDKTHPLQPGTTHTAEILETYPEPREGIFGRVKIIS